MKHNYTYSRPPRTTQHALGSYDIGSEPNCNHRKYGYLTTTTVGKRKWSDPYCQYTLSCLDKKGVIATELQNVQRLWESDPTSGLLLIQMQAHHKRDPFSVPDLLLLQLFVYSLEEAAFTWYAHPLEGSIISWQAM